MAAPRISDLGAVLASTTGKVEVETVGEDTPEERIVERLVTKAVFATFNRRASVDRLTPVIEAFEDGLIIETGERGAVARVRPLDGRGPGPARRGAAPRDVRCDGRRRGPGAGRSAVEFLLEGLHLQRRLNKDRRASGVVYRR